MQLLPAFVVIVVVCFLTCDDRDLTLKLTVQWQKQADL